MEGDSDRTPESILDAQKLGRDLAQSAQHLPHSDPPSVPSMTASPEDPMKWAQEAVGLMAARVDQMMKVSREAWQGLASASAEMLATCKVMQAVIGEQARMMSQLSTGVQQMGTATSALVNLSQDYQAYLEEFQDLTEGEPAQQNGRPVR